MTECTFINDLQTPCLVLDHNKVQKNAERILAMSKQYGVDLRPHFKTTKCVEAAILQTGGSKRGMVVSTLAEAQLLYQNGFDDILLGVPLSMSKMKRCADLTEYMERFCVMVDSQEMADFISNSRKKFPLKNGKKWNVFLKVDCENGRCGVFHDSDSSVDVACTLSKSSNVHFCGLYAHCGDSYHQPGVEAIHKVATKTTQCLVAFKNKLEAAGIECKTYGIGSTPTCSQPCEAMRQLTEWHPGNYILYDQMQKNIGSCSSDDIAVQVITRVIGHYPDSKTPHMIIDCGFTALSLHGKGDCCGMTPGSGYGCIVGHPELKLVGMSQEHGVVVPSNDNASLDFNCYPLDTLLRILPDHSCATCAMHPVFYVADKEGRIIDQWTPIRGW
ncbi:D-serine dehydratase-like [Clytia hemisphaerica]|uniref:D-serine dehydratase-like n=1 Tax=Clytia hemisphaerica TaxID=252671 RepID=UPI0034D3F40A|eukprot:TCONS_00013711-protein